MSFYDEQIANIQRVAAEVYLPTFRDTLKKEGRNSLIDKCHQMVDVLLEKSGLWEQASCSKACSFCCHDTIYMSKLESQYVEDMINKHSIQANKDRLQKQNTLPKEQIKWVDKACPMLADENEQRERPCTIYKFRPLVCRAHNSIEDYKNCDRSEHPNRSVQEGRVVEAEAIGIALMMLDQEISGVRWAMPRMYAMHELNI